MREEIRAVFGKTLADLLKDPKTFGRSITRTGQPTHKVYNYAIWLCYMACRENAIDWEVAVVLLSHRGYDLTLTGLQIHRLRQWDQYIEEIKCDQEREESINSGY